MFDVIVLDCISTGFLTWEAPYFLFYLFCFIPPWQLSSEVSEHFVQGCAKFARQTLAGGVSALEDYQLRAQEWKESVDSSLVRNHFS